MSTELVYGTTSRVNYMAISAYKEVENPDEWLACPECGLKPLIWEYNNGRSTACGCGESDYRHLSIYAESIMSFMRHSHNGQSCVGYDRNELCDNWNHYVNTGEIKFEYPGKRTDGRW